MISRSKQFNVYNLDIDECSATPTICGSNTCENRFGSYTCKCPDGFFLVENTCEGKFDRYSIMETDNRILSRKLYSLTLQWHLWHWLFPDPNINSFSKTGKTPIPVIYAFIKIKLFKRLHTCKICSHNYFSS